MNEQDFLRKHFKRVSVFPSRDDLTGERRMGYLVRNGYGQRPAYIVLDNGRGIHTNAWWSEPRRA